MPDARLRTHIAMLAARLMYAREEREYYTAKRKAARQLGLTGRYRPGDLPSNAEIRDQVLGLARFFEGDRRTDRLREMRLHALALMRLLDAFSPKLIGSTLTGHVRQGSDVDLHVFADGPTAIEATLREAGLTHTLERKRVVKHGEARLFTHLHLTGGAFAVELTLYPLDKLRYAFKSSITGTAIDSATLPQLEGLMRGWYPDVDLDAEVVPQEDEARFDRYRALLRPLESVRQNPDYHPEGDALFHSLQVFELARHERPWDEEFLLAALLHDVGKAIAPRDHVRAGVEALGDSVTPRTVWLIEHHMEAHELIDGTLGHRATQRLRAHEDFEELMALQRCDRDGRRPGARVGTVDAALAYVRELTDG